MVTQIRHETHNEALLRLFQVVRDSGVQLKLDTLGDYWATSVSEPGLLHAMTPTSCSCRGFSRAGRCQHVAALLSHLGRIDGDPDPDGGAAALPCLTCRYAGSIVQHHSRWVGGSRLGFRDEWDSVVACPTCGEEELVAA